MRRIVVTGLGMVTPVGNDVQSSWKAILEGKSGVGPITRFDPKDFGSQIAAEVKDFDPTKYLPPKEARRFDRFVTYGVAAAIQAFTDSGLSYDESNVSEAERAGVMIGSGIGGLPMLCDAYGVYLERGPRRFSPFLIPGSIVNMAAGQVSIMCGLKGPNIAPVSACATGLHAIGEASWMIARGDADVMLAGGCESAMTPDAVGGFDNMHALSRQNETPQKASRPFDTARDGFVIGEGAGVVVLEEYEHALARGAHIYCELLGYGLSGDAYHITTPSTDGPMRSMKMALHHADISADAVDYVNAHGTSTPVGDINECKAIVGVFGEHAKKMWVSSTKGATGHALGAAGAIESIFTILAIRDQVVPPTINIENLDPECDVNICANTPVQTEIKIAMKNNFGFGGTNATLIFKKL